MFSVDTNKLKGKIVENNITQETVARRIGMDRSTFYRKVKQNGSKFTIEEIHKIMIAIPLSKEEGIEIFLSSK